MGGQIDPALLFAPEGALLGTRELDAHILGEQYDAARQAREIRKRFAVVIHK